MLKQFHGCCFSQDPAVHNAVLCLDSQTITDTYTVALMAYAYTLWDKTSRQRSVVMDRLEELATVESAVKYWKEEATPTTEAPEDGWVHHHRTPSADVEMTSYALMAYLAGEGQQAFAQVLPIVQWLTQQRNANGGFSSTQVCVEFHCYFAIPILYDSTVYKNLKILSLLLYLCFRFCTYSMTLNLVGLLICASVAVTVSIGVAYTVSIGVAYIVSIGVAYICVFICIHQSKAVVPSTVLFPSGHSGSPASPVPVCLHGAARQRRHRENPGN